MGYLGRRIGKAQNQGDSNPSGADGAVGEIGRAHV